MLENLIHKDQWLTGGDIEWNPPGEISQHVRDTLVDLILEQSHRTEALAVPANGFLSALRPNWASKIFHQGRADTQGQFILGGYGFSHIFQGELYAAGNTSLGSVSVPSKSKNIADTSPVFCTVV